MTYRERREARAERLREWAAKRQASATVTLQAIEPYTTDHAFNTQPGHIPLRARINAQEERAFESLRKADSMGDRAASIEAAADRAIYSDDPDAVEALTERIAMLEAERDRIKAYNATCRKGKPDLAVLDEKQKQDLAVCLRFQAYACKNGQFPSYALTNLSGNIAKQRERLNRLSGTPDTAIRCYACHRKIAKAKTCAICGEPVNLCGHCAYKPSNIICEQH